MIDKYFDGELNASEKVELLKTLSTDNELKQTFIARKNLLGLVSLSDQLDDPDENLAGYERFIAKLNRKKTLRLTRNIASYAAAVALLVVSTWWITRQNTQNVHTTQYQTLYVPVGQHVNLTLQDGTAVWLNAQTTLTYPTLFTGKERRVSVDGEAYFEIAKDTQKPFIVSAQGVEMQALGTQFNVYCDTENQSVLTSLIEGGLKVYFPDAKADSVTLQANQQVLVQDHKMAVESIPYLDYFLWKKGIYSFHDKPLGEVLKKLELYYDVKIIVKDPSIEESTYTGKIRHRDGIDDIIRVISKIHHFKVQKEEETNIITLK
jgi:ferric-dicitrate binding protein FerR (iron transport regulator)